LAITVVGDAKRGACKREEKESGDTNPPFLLLLLLLPSPPPNHWFSVVGLSMETSLSKH
jgi:hypothetical protein